jgi:hypothetical protein
MDLQGIEPWTFPILLLSNAEFTGHLMLRENYTTKPQAHSIVVGKYWYNVSYIRRLMCTLFWAQISATHSAATDRLQFALHLRRSEPRLWLNQL